MESCFEIIENINDLEILDSILLSYDNRFIRRKKLTSNNGIEFIVNLAETKSLYHNQAFKLESNKLILIKSQSEKLLEITGDNLMKLIWHIGNRHMPCQIEENRVVIQYDKVIKAMILQLGGMAKEIVEPFNPEGGAYGVGRTHSHKH